MSLEYIQIKKESPAIFASTLAYLPDFWEADLDPQPQHQRLVMAMQRQREFVRSLGILPAGATVELRLIVDPQDPDPVRFAYIVSVPEVQWAETIWRMFHAAFPADLDYRPQPVPHERIAGLCDPLHGQATHFYEWYPQPERLALPDEQWFAVMGLPDYRPDQGVQLLRLLAQQTRPLVLGFAIQTIPAGPAYHADWLRLEAMQLHWQELLKDLDAILMLMRVPRGDLEVQERFGDPVETMVRDITADRMESPLWRLLEHEWRRQGPLLTPLYLLESARDTALRTLQTGRHFLWRVHAAAPSPLPPEVGAAVEGELARGSDEQHHRRYLWADMSDRPEMRDLYTRIAVGGWQPWPDNPSAYEPAGEYIDEEGATALLSLPILPQGGIPGVRSYPANPFSSWQLIESTAQHQGRGSDEIVIGDYIDRRVAVINPRYHGVTLSINDLTRHTLITGSTGAGKSTTCQRILVELSKHDIPFLVIEPVKDEYGGLAFSPAFMDRHDLSFHRLAAPTDSLWLNPFYIRKGISLDTHLSYIQSAFMAAFPLYGIQAMVLKRVLRQAYLNAAYRCQTNQSKHNLRPLGYGFTVCRRQIGNRKIIDDAGNEKEEPVFLFEGENTSLPVTEALRDKHFPTLHEVALVAKTEIERLGYRGEFQSDLKAAIQLRLESLGIGIIGRLLQPQPHRPSFEASVGNYLNKPTVIQLGLVADKEEKALAMAFILTALYEYYELQPSTPSLRHVTLLEEAHVLLENTARHQDKESANTRAKAIELFVDMLAEIRSRGEGFIIAEQLPSKLVPEAIKNTNLKIMHRLTARDDREMLGAAMNLNERQSRFTTTLEQGQAIIFREGLTEPALVRIKPVEMDNRERIMVSAAVDSLKVNEQNRRRWPDSVVQALKQYRDEPNAHYANRLGEVICEWLENQTTEKPSTAGLLWFLRRMYAEIPTMLPYGELKRHLLKSER